jgi:hypothetical protein
VTTKKVFRDAAGGVQLSSTIVYSARNDGSSASITTTLANDGGRFPNVTKVVVDVATKRRVVVSMRSRSLTAYHLTDNDIKSITTSRQDSGCLIPGSNDQSSDADPSALLGFNVVKIRNEQRGEHFRIPQETWMAPDLDCYVVKQNALVYRDGKLSGTNTIELASLRKDEVNEDAFLVPSNFTERKPSEVLMLERRAIGLEDCLECEAHAVASQDAGYMKKQLR